jgi:tetratricopeptide (TPR) repeat protein
VQNALNGQEAVGRFRAAQAALDRGDFALASSEAQAGRGVAPWDSRGPELLSRIQTAQQRAQAQTHEAEQRQRQQQRTTQVAELLNKADAALGAGQLDRAIALYDQVLDIDPSNQRAGMGKTGALTARAQAQASATGPARAAVRSKSFVNGKTVAQSVETRSGGAVPEGFEAADDIPVKRGTQAAELPGRILFEVRPEAVQAGEKYTVSVYLVNEGNASIQLKELFVTTTVNGRKAGGGIPLQVSEVAPRQKAMLLSQSDLWKEDFTSWAMEVSVRTARGELYRNQVTWR